MGQKGGISFLEQIFFVSPTSFLGNFVAKPFSKSSPHAKNFIRLSSPKNTLEFFPYATVYVTLLR